MTIKIRTITPLIKLGAIALFVAGDSVLTQTLPLPNNLISFNSEMGEQLLLQSKAREDFWDLSTQYVTQNTQSYCGVASIVMVLNALSIPAPIAPEYTPYRVFTQANFFNNASTKKVLAPEVVARQGMTLEQLGQLLASYGVEAKVYHSTNTNIEQFRQLVIQNLRQENNFVLANYLRRKIGQERGGHISPLAAYNQQTDRFLILDVSRYKYPPVWVKAADLWQAMDTEDRVSGKTRGFVLVSQKVKS
ncbi:phytochelatin synthase family protein [Chroococcidiopsis thermalis]|uniref:glutathione gamma-glutamylcysteinyltransferase n=1 Tax=Chroococcidiopsis thermalis (strain PCC 7203) TaxID=251229 RepID=K9TYJ3_CHRTP|nr:phytochelatin synthase family protein [Chroococcidiopsis thermalis]AFY87892.1 Glutathione gamma-glutamylcysteinyltransferase [Chroococcidiopsis thermalis PCC 7203]